MDISAHLFEAYLKCPTKCFLRSLGDTATGNHYSEWLQAQQDSYRSEEIKRLAQGVTENECVSGPIGRENVQSAKWRLALETTVRTQSLESIIHALERLTSDDPDKPALFIPIRFAFANQIRKDDKLLVAFDAFVLSELLSRDVDVGKIIHGDEHATLKVNTGALASEVRKLTAEISALLSSNAPPELILNRHCPQCEFRDQCRQKALERDDLSLLSGMSETERSSHRSRGIFTVTQLSYTFRARRTPKRVKNPAMPHYFALQARAIRENTVHIHGTHCFPKSETQIYLDIEGLPDNRSYYLIGALVVSEGNISLSIGYSG